MRFGIYLNPQTPGPESDGRVIDEVLDLVDLADSIGFENVWITDHQFTGYNAFSDPMTIGLSVAVAPLTHPIRFATQANLVSQLSHGRFLVGLGPGNSPDEYRGYGLDASVRHEMMQEFLAVLEKAWEAPEGG